MYPIFYIMRSSLGFTFPYYFGFDSSLDYALILLSIIACGEKDLQTGEISYWDTTRKGVNLSFPSLKIMIQKTVKISL